MMGATRLTSIIAAFSVVCALLAHADGFRLARAWPSHGITGRRAAAATSRLAAVRLSDAMRPDLDEYLAQLFQSEIDPDGLEATRMFNVSSEHVEEMDEFMLMFKMRKELGDEDFKAIFGGIRVSGPNLDDMGPKAR